MVAKTPKSTETKAPRKARQAKAVNDLPSATVAQKAAQRRYDRADKAYGEAQAERGAALIALEASKNTTRKFYAELMGEAEDVTEQLAASYEPDGLEVSEDDGAGA